MTTEAPLSTTISAPVLIGDANCDGAADVADAVLIARFCVEDHEAVITEQGMRNADCDRSGKLTAEDVTVLLQAIAKIIRLD